MVFSYFLLHHQVFCGLTSDGQLIAVKQIELNVHDWDKAEKEYESIQEEVDLLKTLKHTNIVGLVNVSELLRWAQSNKAVFSHLHDEKYAGLLIWDPGPEWPTM